MLVNRIYASRRFASLFCVGACLVNRALKHGETAGDAFARKLEERSEAERARNEGGVLSEPFEFVARCPIRFEVGGPGCSRFLFMYSHLAPLKMWSDLNSLPVAHCRMSLDVLDGLVPPPQPVVECSKPMACRSVRWCA